MLVFRYYTSPTIFQAFDEGDTRWRTMHNKRSEYLCSHTQGKRHVLTAEFLTLWEITIVSGEQFFITNALKFTLTDDKLHVPSWNTLSN